MGSKNKNQKTCYIYTRVSTAIQIDGYSLDAQRERLLKEAKHRGYKVIGEYSDEGHSGKNIKGRPEFQRMLEDIRTAKEKPDYVYVFKLSRFGRNAADTLSALQYLEDFGVSLLCVEDGIDSAGAAGKLLIAVYAAVAEAERENIHAQTMAGRWQKAREGGWNGGFAPYGYKLVDGELQIADDEADLIRIIFQMYLMPNVGINTVARRLNQMGFKKKVRNNANTDRIGSSFVKSVLDNPVYAGYLPYGRRKTEKIEGTRNETHVVKQDEYELFDGRHEAIISKKIWEKAKAKREETGYAHEKRFSLEHAHILSGILKCPKCGARMYGNVNRKKKRDGSGYYPDTWYYVCKHRTKVDGATCDFKKYVRQSDVNKEMYSIIAKLFNNDATNEFYAKDFLAESIDIENLTRQRESLVERRKEVEGKKVRLLSKIAEMDSNDPHYDDMYDGYNGLIRGFMSEISDLDSQIADLSASIETNGARKESLENMKATVAEVWSHLDEISEEYVKMFMNEFVEDVQILEEPDVVNGQNLWIKSVKFKILFKHGDDVGRDFDINHVLQPKSETDETVVLLSTQKTKRRINIVIDTDSLDLTREEAKATYEQIKAYIMEKHGVKVSNLYIAQIKRKCGIKLAENFNLPKSEDAKQPVCPAEKEEYIIEALKHFKMI